MQRLKTKAYPQLPVAVGRSGSQVAGVGVGGTFRMSTSSYTDFTHVPLSQSWMEVFLEPGATSCRFHKGNPEGPP